MHLLEFFRHLHPLNGLLVYWFKIVFPELTHLKGKHTYDGLKLSVLSPKVSLRQKDSFLKGSDAKQWKPYFLLLEKFKKYLQDWIKNGHNFLVLLSLTHGIGERDLCSFSLNLSRLWECVGQ